MYETFPNKSPSTLAEQQVAKDKFIPKRSGGKDGTPGHPSGKTSYPCKKPSSQTRNEGKERQVSSMIRAGGSQPSETYPKKGHSERSEKMVGRDKFVPCFTGRTAPNKR